MSDHRGIVLAPGGTAGSGGGPVDAADVAYDPTVLAGLGTAGIDDVQKLDQVFTGFGSAIGTLFAALGGKQGADADLDAVAALVTTAFGRALLELADAAAGRTALGLGSAATQAASAFQPTDSDLTAIAALTTTAFGRSLLTQSDAAAARTALGVPDPTITWTTVQPEGTGGGVVEFQNGWVAGSTGVKFTKVLGVLGVITGLADGTDATDVGVFTLPAGTRPGNDAHRGSMRFGGAEGRPHTPFAIDIPSGIVELLPGEDPTAYTSPNVSLDGMFLVEA